MSKIKNLISDIEENREFIYLVVLAVALFTMLLSQTVIMSESIYGGKAKLVYDFAKNIRYYTYIVFLIVIAIDVIKGYSQRIPTIVVLITGAVAYLLSKDFQIFSYVIIVLAAVNVDILKVMRIYMVEIAIVLLVFSALASVDIIFNYIDSPSTRHRESLGFFWTSIPATLWWSFINVLCFIRKEKIKKMELFFIAFITVLMFVVTDAKGYLMAQVFVLVMMLINIYKHEWIKAILNIRVIRYIIYVSPFIAAAFIYTLSYLYNPANKIMTLANSALSDRLRLAKKGIDEIGLSIFGQNVKWVGYTANVVVDKDEYNFVDTAYMYVGMNYGVVILLMALLGFSIIIMRAIKKENYGALIAYLSVIFISLTENRLINIIYTPFIICFASILENRNGEKHE